MIDVTDTDKKIAASLGIAPHEVASFREKGKGSMPVKVLAEELKIKIEAIRTTLESADLTKVTDLQGQVKGLRIAISVLVPN